MRKNKKIIIMRKKELRERIEFLEGEIDKLNRGETSEYAESLREFEKNRCFKSFNAY